eukprot:jgi/Mesvir1/24401/Mv11069-RA.1
MSVSLAVAAAGAHAGAWSKQARNSAHKIAIHNPAASCNAKTSRNSLCSRGFFNGCLPRSYAHKLSGYSNKTHPRQSHGRPLFIAASAEEQVAEVRFGEKEWRHVIQVLHKVNADMVASGGNAQPDIIAHLTETGLDIAAFFEEAGLTALHLAAQEGLTEVVKLLLAGGVDVNAVSEDGLTALHLAAAFNKADVVDLLVRCANADLDARADDGCNALHLAAQGGHVRVAASLITAGCDVNADVSSFSPLHIATSQGHVEMVKVLLAPPTRGGRTTTSVAANINCVTEEGVMPLHLAAGLGHLQLVNLLLDQVEDKVAAMSARTIRDETPLDLAREAGHEAVAAHLQRLMASDV